MCLYITYTHTSTDVFGYMFTCDEGVVGKEEVISACVRVCTFVCVHVCKKQNVRCVNVK